jgi:hypothetical protein
MNASHLALTAVSIAMALAGVSTAIAGGVAYIRACHAPEQEEVRP